MQNRFVILFILSFNLIQFRVFPQQSVYENLAGAFRNPPSEARPRAYFWCLNGHIDTVRAKIELKAMKDAGLSGFDLFEIGVPPSDTMVPAGPAFLSDESLKLIKAVVNEAGRLGLTMGLNVASSWNAGGSWVKPEHAGKSLYFSKVSLSGVQGKIETKLPFPEVKFPKSSLVGGTGKELIPYNDNGRPAYYEELAVLAVPAGKLPGSVDSSSVVDLTSGFDYNTDILRWEVPAGEWDIYRYICSNSGQQLVLPSPYSAGLTIDHFDSVAVEMHFQYVFDRLLPVLGDFRKTALKSLYLASYEARGLVWTSSMRDEFRRLNGYDIIKLLPLITDPELFNSEIKEKVISDFRKTLSELMINNLYGKAREICNKYGLKINSEAGGPGYPLYNGPAEPLKALGSIDIPRGEFWINHSRYYKDDNGIDSIDILRVVKEVAAASHIYEKGIVEMESFSSFQHWQEGPNDLKPMADRAFCEGLNKVVLHGFNHNPSPVRYPGYVYHAGTHFSDVMTWWPVAGPFFDYLARVSFIAQNSKFMADVVWYYGEKVPNSATPKNAHFRVGPGYDYEVINSDILVNKLFVKDGKLCLPDGSSFSLLAIEKEKFRSPGVEQALKRLSSQGAVITGTEPEEMLKYLTVKPDFIYRDHDKSILDFIHYKKENIDFYFIRNSTGEWISRQCGFRQTDKTPQLWDPESGNIVPVRIFVADNEYVKLPVSLAPYGSCIIAFSNSETIRTYAGINSDTQDPPVLEYLQDGLLIRTAEAYSQKNKNQSKKVISPLVINLDGPWTLRFSDGRGAPSSYTLNSLKSLAEVDDMKIRAYSGQIVYEKPFTFRYGRQPMNDKKIFIDLGTVEEVAEVWMNNKLLGVSWTKPHRFEITDAVIHGENYLTVKVYNTWSNRIIGDAVYNERYAESNITHTLIPGTEKTYVPWKDVPFTESGLLGPVTIETISVIR